MPDISWSPVLTPVLFVSSVVTLLDTAEIEFVTVVAKLASSFKAAASSSKVFKASGAASITSFIAVAISELVA